MLSGSARADNRIWDDQLVRTRALRSALWPAAAVVGIAAESSLYGWGHPGDWVPDVLTGWSLIGCGLVGWARRPESRSGVLMVAAGFAWFVPNFATTGAHAIDWLGAHALYLHRGPLVQLVLTYPRGRPARRLDRAALVVGYAIAIITPIWRSEITTIVLTAVLIAVGLRAYLGAAGRERRMTLAALRAATLFAAALAATAAVRLAWPTAAGAGRSRACARRSQPAGWLLASGSRRLRRLRRPRAPDPRSGIEALDHNDRARRPADGSPDSRPRGVR
jgi:hypothetical protein